MLVAIMQCSSEDRHCIVYIYYRATLEANKKCIRQEHSYSSWIVLNSYIFLYYLSPCHIRSYDKKINHGHATEAQSSRQFWRFLWPHEHFKCCRCVCVCECWLICFLTHMLVLTLNCLSREWWCIQPHHNTVSVENIKHEANAVTKHESL